MHLSLLWIGVHCICASFEICVRMSNRRLVSVTFAAIWGTLQLLVVGGEGVKVQLAWVRFPERDIVFAFCQKHNACYP